MKKINKSALAAALIIGTLTAPVMANKFGLFSDMLGSSQKTLTMENRIVGKGTIYKVIDGDTVWLNVSPALYQRFKEVADTKDKQKALRDQYRSVKMRISSINTAESVHRDTTRNSAEGKKASDFLKSKADGQPASFGCWDHGKYGRPICGVAVNGYDIGLMMIERDYSEYVSKYGNHPYLHEKYKQASR